MFAMRKLTLLVGVALLLATKTFAQTTPPNTSALGQVLDLHGVGEYSGRYIQWAYGSGDWNLGWLRLNPDGSSYQLMAKFRNNANVSRDLTSLFIIDSKTGQKISLLPNTPRTSWVLSWVGPNFLVMNRTSSGLFYGLRGTPSSLQVKETAGVYEEPRFNISADLTKGPQHPAADGRGLSLGTYKIQVSSSKPLLQSDLEILLEVDDSKGKTVRSELLRVPPPAAANSTSTSFDLVLGSGYYTLPSGDYTLNLEVRDYRVPVGGGKFVAGLTKLMSVKTTTVR